MNGGQSQYIESRITRREVGRGALLAWLGVVGNPKIAGAKQGDFAGGAVHSWRADFPALNQRVNGRPLACLDSAAATQRPIPVIDAILDFYRHHSQEYEHGSHKFSAGAPNVSGAVGLAAAIRYLNSQNRAAIEAHELQLTRHGLRALPQIPGLRLLGPKDSEPRIPVLRASCYLYTQPEEIDQLASALGQLTRSGAKES